MRIGSLETVILEILAQRGRPVGAAELRRQALRRHLDCGDTETSLASRSFASSFSRALRSMERKGLLRLSRRRDVSRWPQQDREGTVYRVARLDQ